MGVSGLFTANENPTQKKKSTELNICLLPEASMFSQQLEHVGFSWFDQSLHEMERAVGSLFASSNQAGILNADSLSRHISHLNSGI